MFTTAGVSQSIYEYSAIRGNPGAETHRPSQELVTRSKLSCLTWNKHLGNCEGAVHVWDIATGQNVAEYVAHGRRFCSVEFCPENPKLLMSGLDDGIVKVCLSYCIVFHGLHSEAVTWGKVFSTHMPPPPSCVWPVHSSQQNPLIM